MKPIILGLLIIVGSIFFANATANAEPILSSSEYMQKETAALYEFCSVKAKDPRIKSQIHQFVLETFNLENGSDDFLEAYGFDLCMAAKTKEAMDSWYHLLQERSTSSHTPPDTNM